ncbi:hypothetical protein [Mycolicibacterium duvalii]|nr:hypothetical protein [Mycolicibacterium duvalii]MCV7368137.1 hypothetical protein [Mycolicibacterium duvalii]
MSILKMFGHTSAKVTLDTYADLFDTDLDAVGITLDQSYSLTSVSKKGVNRGQLIAQQI